MKSKPNKRLIIWLTWGYWAGRHINNNELVDFNFNWYRTIFVDFHLDFKQSRTVFVDFNIGNRHRELSLHRFWVITKRIRSMQRCPLAEKVISFVIPTPDFLLKVFRHFNPTSNHFRVFAILNCSLLASRDAKRYVTSLTVKDVTRWFTDQFPISVKLSSIKMQWRVNNIAAEA